MNLTNSNYACQYVLAETVTDFGVTYSTLTSTIGFVNKCLQPIKLTIAFVASLRLCSIVYDTFLSPYPVFNSLTSVDSNVTT